MLSAFSENMFLSVKKEPCSDEELETEKRSSMDEDTAVSPVQDQPEDLSVKKKERDRSRSNSPRPSSISPPSRSCGSGSPDSQKNGEPSRAKRIKPIPPPLDLNARTLSPSDTLPQGHASLPQSPADLPRECLPIRKRFVHRFLVNCKISKNGLSYMLTTSACVKTRSMIHSFLNKFLIQKCSTGFEEILTSFLFCANSPT